MNAKITLNPINLYKIQNSTDDQYGCSLQGYLEKVQTILENYKIFDLLSEEELKDFFDAIKIKKFYHNQVIYRQNQPVTDVNFILTGAIKLGWSLPNSKYYTHLFVPSGTPINIVPVVTHTAHLHDHIAQGTTVMANIEGKKFLNIFKNNAPVIYALFELVCSRTQLHREQIFTSSVEPLNIRLVKQLLFLVDYHANHDQDRTTLNFKLNQENLAELLQTSRQSVNKELAILAKQGLIDIQYNHIVILDKIELSTLVQSQNLGLGSRFF